MKKFLIFILIIILTGCTNNEETIKNEYIATKSNLLKENIINESSENLPLDITINLNRDNDEIIKYDVILDNPKENLHNIKAMVVHNYYSEELFPSTGVFEEEKSLLTDNKEEKIELSGTIETTKNMSNINLEIKVWLQYQNDSGEIKEIYYKTT